MKNATGVVVYLEVVIFSVVAGVVAEGCAIVAYSGVLVGIVILTKSDAVHKFSILLTSGGSDGTIKSVTVVETSVDSLTGTSVSVIGCSVVVMAAEVERTGMYSWDPRVG